MRRFVSAVRRPDHTGADRCWPCTTANLLLLAAASLALATVWPVAGAVLAVAGALTVWFRGYLVPYTPRVAPRLAARLPWDPFPAGTAGHRPAATAAPAGRSNSDGASGPQRVSGGSDDGGTGPEADDDETAPGTDEDSRGPRDADPAPATLADATTADGEAILGDLVAADVLDATGEDVRPAAAFEERWWDEIRTLRERSPADLAAATLAEAPTASAARTVTDRGKTYVVLSDGSGEPAGEVWLRRPVAVAETAAARALAETDLDAGRRAVAAHGLALFLETCPVCEAELDETKAGGCCGPPRTDAEGHPLQALVCRECRAQFAVFG